MGEQQAIPSATAADAPESRAVFHFPLQAFKRPIPPVPVHAFERERLRAMAPDCPTGLIDLDLGGALSLAWPATTPAILARYAVIREREELVHTLLSTGEVYYVIDGTGETLIDGEVVAWSSGDAFCLPGGHRVKHCASRNALLLIATNEPELCYCGTLPDPHLADRAIKPTLFTGEQIRRQLQNVHEADTSQAAGKAVTLVTQEMQDRLITTPTLSMTMNTLEAGGDQPPHRHSSVALTLCLRGDGVYSMVDDTRVDWMPNLVMLTPPNAVHSHHNRGAEMMLSFVIQDSALHAQLRTSNFSFV